MALLWVRAEDRPTERRVGVTPDGVATLIADGIDVVVEDSPTRVIPMQDYAEAGAVTAQPGAWRDAPDDAVIFGLKELPDEDLPLRHRHVMFGHAFKGQAAGQRLLARFRDGGGTLLDLEYLVAEDGRRVAAFGVWAGFAGAAVALRAWAAQRDGRTLGALTPSASDAAMVEEVRDDLNGAVPSVIIIGAHGRVGSGARDLCECVGATVTGWDMAETASGGPFPEILDHDVFLNCILANDGVPVFVGPDALETERRLRVIGDIACDPDSAFNPVPVYDRVTSWDAPARRVADTPPLDVVAIDNLPSLLPKEASVDYAGQLLPHLRTLFSDPDRIWARAAETFRAHAY